MQTKKVKTKKFFERLSDHRTLTSKLKTSIRAVQDGSHGESRFRGNFPNSLPPQYPAVKHARIDFVILFSFGNLSGKGGVYMQAKI